MKYRAFLNLSGGVDSTYYLWRWLRENPNEIIIVHHCLFLKRRLKEEKEACDKIIAFLRKEGLKNFKYIETGMQKGTMQGKTMDVEMLSGMTGIALKLAPTVTDILLSYCQEETAELHKHLLAGKEIKDFDPKHRYSIVNKVVETLTQRNFNYICYRDEKGGLLSKKAMIKEMPRELFAMTWYCRKPVNGKPCGVCHTCRKVKNATK